MRQPGCAQRDHVAGARLVDHLLVQLAHPRRLLGVGCQINGEQPTVGDGAAGGDGQPLGAGPCGERAVIAVVDQPRPQLGEFGRRVLAGQQIQGGLEHAAGQRREWGAAPHGVEPAVGVERLQGRCRDRVLGQDVQRIGGHPHGLDLAGEHPLHADRAAQQIGAVLGEQHAAGGLTDLVAGPPDALQSAGHRRRCFDLDDQIHRAHVDAELQTGGGHHRLELSALEVLFDDGALLLADRAVVGAGQQGGRAETLSAAHHVRRRAAGLGVGTPGNVDAAAFGMDLVESRGQPLRQPPRVGEHDRRVVRLDQVDQPRLDIGPDGVVGQIGHIGHRHLHGQLDRLGRGRGHDGGSGLTGQEPGQLLGRPHGCRQADALGGPIGQLVEAFQRQRQVGAAFGGGDGVDLIDDDRLHPGQSVPRGRRQHQKERLGSGDQRRAAG